MSCKYALLWGTIYMVSSKESGRIYFCMTTNLFKFFPWPTHLSHFPHAGNIPHKITIPWTPASESASIGSNQNILLENGKFMLNIRELEDDTIIE